MKKLTHVKFVTIDNLTSLSPQEIFDMSFNHVKNQACFVHDQFGHAVYVVPGETQYGCGARPFIDVNKFMEVESIDRVVDCSLNFMGWDDLVSFGYAPNHQTALISQLQIAHDSSYARRLSPEESYEEYVRHMAGIAIVEGLEFHGKP